MKRSRIERESDAPAGVGDGEIPTYWTATCWRSNWGFLGLTARTTTRMTARTMRTMREKRRKRQQQHPLKREEDEEDEYNGVLE